MKKMVWVALPILAACGNSGEEPSAASDNAIVLDCSGESIDLVDSSREPWSYLLRINPDNSFQQSLHFYNWDEKRFVSPCVDKGFECRISVGPDLITESGVMRGSDGQVILEKFTEINRRTGKMRVVLSDNLLGEQPVFEGECAKGELPAEQTQKF